LILQNEEAEELMRHVEQEEEEAAATDPESLQLHLCIINLVIGTLYCSKVCKGGCGCLPSSCDYM
jgi:tetratricopeptide repeat protein 30